MTPKKVLVVEDNPDTSALVRFILEKAGYEVSAAENGSKGIEMAEKLLPDLILMDIMMPEMDGYSLNMRLKENLATRDIPVIVSTARGMLTKLFGPEDKSRVDGILTKPFAPGDLTNLVKKVLENKK